VRREKVEKTRFQLSMLVGLALAVLLACCCATNISTTVNSDGSYAVLIDGTSWFTRSAPPSP
jgi:hypothetical protein